LEKLMSITESAPHATGMEPVPAGHAPPGAHGSQVGHSADEPDGPRRSWTVLAVALTAQILVVLDISVVNTALPSIGSALRLRSGDLAWLVTAYLIMSGGGLLLGGRIADLISRRRVFLTGMTLFTGASILTGFASTAGELIAARAAQGLAAALMTPAALSLVMTTYTGAQRRKGLALWGAVGSLGVAGGVLVGGALTTWAGWETIFWINGPIGAVALAIAYKVLPDNRPEHAGLAQFDLPGAATVLGGLGSLMYALGGTQSTGWTSIRTLGGLAVSVALLSAFAVIERRSSRPLIPPHTWKIQTLVSGTVVMLGVTGLLVGAVFLTSIYVQGVLGYSALKAGLAFLPFAFAITAGTVVARHALAHGTPRSVAGIGMTISAGAFVLLSHAGAGAHYASDLLPGLVLLGLGVGMVFVPVSVSAMAGIPAQHAGVAGGFLMTGHEVGAALGVAVLSAIASSAGSLTSPAGIVDGYSRGFTGAAVIAAVFAVVAFLRMPRTAVAAGAGGMHGHH
jgi:EmrB/QacA subfamily drug resistance transporter